MTRATKLVSIHALFDEVNWGPLETRRMKQRLLLLYKTFNNFSPEYLSKYLGLDLMTEFNLRVTIIIKSLFLTSSDKLYYSN